MAKIITCNTNGIRAAQRKGFFEWLAREQGWTLELVGNPVVLMQKR